jgi:transcriptional regulator with XRE-family HTH domain
MEQISKKIKELRMKGGMTLKELSEITGLSVSFLSQIERGSTSLAITSLKSIADAFNVPMSYFFEEYENQNYIVKKDDQKQFTISGSNICYTRLSGDFPQRKMEILLVNLPPISTYIEKTSHSGEEFHYILKGVVVFKIDQKEYVLKEGDSIHFPSYKMHSWKNPTNEEVLFISVLTPVIF